MKTTRTQNRAVVYLEPEWLAELKRISDETHAPISALLRDAVESWLKHRKKS